MRQEPASRPGRFRSVASITGSARVNGPTPVSSTMTFSFASEWFWRRRHERRRAARPSAPNQLERSALVNTRVAVAVVTSLIALPALADETYVLDPVHSQPRFMTRHLGFTTQLGGFVKSSAKATIDREAKKGTVDVTIDAASVRTQDATRLDAVVKGEKFLNVEKYPTITFTSNDFRFNGDTLAGVNGQLT